MLYFLCITSGQKQCEVASVVPLKARYWSLNPVQRKTYSRDSVCVAFDP